MYVEDLVVCGNKADSRARTGGKMAGMKEQGGGSVCQDLPWMVFPGHGACSFSGTLSASLLH